MNEKSAERALKEQKGRRTLMFLKASILTCWILRTTCIKNDVGDVDARAEELDEDSLPCKSHARLSGSTPGIVIL